MEKNKDILVKIYLEEGNIVFEALSNEVVKDKLYPPGNSRIGTVCINADKHVGVTKEAFEPLKQLLQATHKNNDCIGDIDMWDAQGKMCFSWIGPIKRVFTIGKHNQTGRDTVWDFDKFVILED